MSKNKLNLTLPPPGASSDGGPLSASSTSSTGVSRGARKRVIITYARARINELSELFANFGIDETDKDTLEEFLDRKEKIEDLREEDLEIIEDLSLEPGYVVKARHKQTDIIMARKLKKLEVKTATREQILRDLKQLDTIIFPHVLGYYGFFFGDGPTCGAIQNVQLSMCMDYQGEKSMKWVLYNSGRVPEPIIGKVTVGVMKGLRYLLDKHNIIHHSVKPSNILINPRGEVRICDYRLPNVIREAIKYNYISKRIYKSPERIQGGLPSVPADIWALGLTLLEMILGVFPIPALDQAVIDRIFSDETVEVPPTELSIYETLDYIVVQPPPKVEHEAIPKDFQNFVEHCLKKMPTDRAGYVLLMTHPWYEKYTNETVDVAEWAANTLSVPVKPQPVQELQLF